MISTSTISLLKQPTNNWYVCFLALRSDASLPDIFSSGLLPSLRVHTSLYSSQRYVCKPISSACGFSRSLCYWSWIIAYQHFQPIEQQRRKRCVLFSSSVFACYCLPIIKSYTFCLKYPIKERGLLYKTIGYIRGHGLADRGPYPDPPAG